MKIDRIITSSNELQTYLEFWPIVSTVWKNAGFKITMNFITKRKDDDILVKELREYGEVNLIEPIEGISDSILAKTSRMVSCCDYTNEVCCIVDIDDLPLNIDFLTDCAAEFDENCIGAMLGTRVYADTINKKYPGTKDSIGKFPIPYTVGKGSVFKEIINPNNLNFIDLLNSWKNLKQDIFDGFESVSNNYKNFSDESLFRYLINKWKHKHTRFIQNPSLKYCRAAGMQKRKYQLANHISDGSKDENGKVLRVRWGNFDLKKLKNNYYVDVSSLRPYSIRYNDMKDVLNFIGITEPEKLILKNNTKTF